MAEGFKVLPIANAFSKGFVEGKGKNKIPSYFASYLRNIRIQNSAITQRYGHESVVESNIGTYIKGLAKNKSVGVDSIFACVNNTFRPVDLSTATYGASVGALAGDTDCNVIQYGQYSIILTGVSRPFIRDGTTFSQVPLANMPNNDTPAVNPIIGETFANFTFIAGNTPGTDNVLYICVPPLPTTQTNCYDWNSAGSDSLVFSSKILGLRATINRLFVFTEKTIEVITPESLQATVTISSPIAQGELLASYGSVVAAGTLVMFLTASNKIKTIGYTPGITESQVGELSDRPLIGIDQFIGNLASDQSLSFGYFNKNQNIVKWFLKSQGSTVNDISLVYDFVNDSWFVDNNKYFNKFIEFGGGFYCGSMISANIYRDEFGYADDTDPVSWQYETPDLNFGSPVNRKQFKEVTFAGQINVFTKINVKVLVDGQTVFQGTIDGSTFLTTGTALLQGIGSKTIGGEPIGGFPFVNNNIATLYGFETAITKGNLRCKGKQIKIVLSGAQIGQNFSMDSLSFTIRPVGNYDLKDQF